MHTFVDTGHPFGVTILLDLPTNQEREHPHLKNEKNNSMQQN